MTEGPLISVIVTAYHGRKGYLIEAVKSVLEQDFDRSRFEIIVIKDFRDGGIDAWLANTTPAVRVHTEDLPSLGSKLAKGLEMARGDILCFLEDDDRFRTDKLSHVATLFSRQPGTGFVHNAHAAIDSVGRVLPSRTRLFSQAAESFTLVPVRPAIHNFRKALRQGAFFNTSSISLRATLLRPWVGVLRTLDTAPDRFLFFIAALSETPMVIDSTRLTCYRIHPSTSNALIEEGGERRYLGQILQGVAVANAMVAISQIKAPTSLAAAFAKATLGDCESAAFLLDPERQWSLRGWIGFGHSIFWRRDVAMGLNWALCACRALQPHRTSRYFREWQRRFLIRAVTP